MEQNTKTNEQLHQEFEQALANLSEKLSALLHHGLYTLEQLSRDWNNQKVEWASMTVGEHRIILQATSEKYGRKEGTEVRVYLPENPVNEKLIKAWDKQTIDSDIEFYQKKLDALLKQKESLNVS
jgi:S-adenosylmethionine:diacylglycerol 3-amino-3-carboxypropyl transferase